VTGRKQPRHDDLAHGTEPNESDVHETPRNSERRMVTKALPIIEPIGRPAVRSAQLLLATIIEKLANSFRSMENASRRLPEYSSRMSPFTRYAFSLLIVVYGVYQLMNDRPVPAVIAFVLAAFIFWISRGR